MNMNSEYTFRWKKFYLFFFVYIKIYIFLAFKSRENRNLDCHEPLKGVIRLLT